MTIRCKACDTFLLLNTFVRTHLIFIPSTAFIGRATMLRQAARKIVQQVSGVEQESQIHHFFNRYPIENVASPLDCWAAVVRPQWNAGPIWFSTGHAALSPPQVQTSEEAREKVDDADEGDITAAKVQHGDGSATENFHEDEEHVPNMDYLRQKDYLMMYPRYEKEYMEKIAPKHQQPQQWHEKTGLWAVTAMRWSFDKLTGYPHNMTEKKWLQRIVFLETVAGVPGMSGAMLRHMKSLRNMKRDNGWIHTLLEEAENERMHLLTFMQMKKPGPLFRGFVLLTQGVFFNLYTMFYLMSPKHCHAFVGYLEEEAVKTYTHCIKDIDEGRLEDWKTLSPPEFSRYYWGLPENSTMRDLIMAVRADEYSHSHVNHTFAKLKHEDQNPFEKGAHTVP